MKIQYIAGVVLLTVLLGGCAENEAPKYERINIYENVVVQISGIAPYVDAELKLLSEQDWYGVEDFEISQSENIKNGDGIKVTCTISKERQNEAGYDLLLTEKIYSVNGADMYLNQLEQISNVELEDKFQKCVNRICKDTENTEDRMMYALTGNSNYLFQYNKERVEDIGLYKVILCTPVDYQKKDLKKNILYLVLKAQIANGDYTEEGYFVFEFDDLVLLSDGTIQWNYDAEKQQYIMATDYEELEKMLLSTKDGNYYVGQKNAEDFSLESGLKNTP